MLTNMCEAMTRTVRSRIIATYSEWTALSALRAGAPIKSRRDVYTAIQGVDFAVLFAEQLGPIDRATFDSWHESTVESLIARQPKLTVGWAAKIVNVYLKTRAYVGGEGREQLQERIHPPIDAGLWLGLRRRFEDEDPRPDILTQTHCVNRIRDIVDYECYRRIIDGCRVAAGVLGCHLIEVEQLWAGTEFVDSVARDEV
jgi:hypothetical protein